MTIFSKHLGGGMARLAPLATPMQPYALFALCIKLLWAKLFLKRVPRHFWTLKVCITQNKKNFTSVF